MTTHPFPTFRAYYWVAPGTYDCIPCRECNATDERIHTTTRFMMGRSVKRPIPVGVASSAPQLELLYLTTYLGNVCCGVQLLVDRADLVRADLCIACGRPPDKVRVCRTCATHTYCGEECETKHKEVHQPYCISVLDEWREHGARMVRDIESVTADRPPRLDGCKCNRRARRRKCCD